MDRADEVRQTRQPESNSKNRVKIIIGKRQNSTRQSGNSHPKGVPLTTELGFRRPRQRQNTVTGEIMELPDVGDCPLTILLRLCNLSSIW